MFFIITFIGLFILNSFLILSRPINVFPEVFFFSWLIKKGLLPYRDFFDDHGFFLQWLLSPLTIDKSLLLIKATYFLLHAFNLLLVLLIIKKNKSKLSYFFGGLIYVLLMFFLSENDFWFELLITTFYLSAYLILISKKPKWKNFIVGLFIGLAALVKPTAGLVIAPVFFIKKRLSIILGFILPLFLTVIYFLLNNGLSGLIDDLIGYNLYLAKFYRPVYLSDQKFLVTGIFLIILSMLAVFVSKQRNKTRLTTIFLFCSLIFLVSGYTRVRLVPIATFFSIFIAITISIIKPKYRLIYFPIIVVYCLVMIVKVYQHYSYLGSGKRIPYIEEKTGQLITSYLKQNKLSENFFILGNTVQPYYLLNHLPPTYFPLRYPMVEKYYPDFEERLISDIKRKKVTIVVIVPGKEFNWRMISLFIKKNFKLRYDSGEFQVYQKGN